MVSWIDQQHREGQISTSYIGQSGVSRSTNACWKLKCDPDFTGVFDLKPVWCCKAYFWDTAGPAGGCNAAARAYRLTYTCRKLWCHSRGSSSNGQQTLPTQDLTTGTCKIQQWAKTKSNHRHRHSPTMVIGKAWPWAWIQKKQPPQRVLHYNGQWALRSTHALGRHKSPLPWHCAQCKRRQKRSNSVTLMKVTTLSLKAFQWHTR